MYNRAFVFVNTANFFARFKEKIINIQCSIINAQVTQNLKPRTQNAACIYLEY